MKTILAFALALCLAGCNQTQPTADPTTPQPQVKTQITKMKDGKEVITISVVQP